MIDLSALSTQEVNDLIADVRDEMRRRRVEYIQKAAESATISVDEASRRASAGRVSYSLPLGDWALVRLAIGIKTADMAVDGCIAFWPIITPETRSPEYRELFEESRI